MNAAVSKTVMGVFSSIEGSNPSPSVQPNGRNTTIVLEPRGMNQSRWERLAPLTGVISVVIIVAVFAIGGSTPEPEDGAAKVQASLGVPPTYRISCCSVRECQLRCR